MKQPNLEKNSKRTIFSFDKVALIISFIVDTITLGSIIFSLNIKSLNIRIPIFISPTLAFLVWFLTLYIYFAFLHDYWEKNAETKGHPERFLHFLDELIFRFRNPILLFPGVILVIIFYSIIFVTSIVIFNFLLILSGLFAIMIFFVKSLNSSELQADVSTTKNIEVQITPDVKSIINDNWKQIEAAIEKKLERHQWINCNDLDDIVEVYEIPHKNISYIMANFAVKHPAETAYGSLLRLADYEMIEDNALINLEHIDRKRFFYR